MEPLGGDGCPRAARLGDACAAFPYGQRQLVGINDRDQVDVDPMREMRFDPWTEGGEVEGLRVIHFEDDMRIADRPGSPASCDDSVLVEEVLNIWSITGGHGPHIDRCLTDRRVFRGGIGALANARQGVDIDLQGLHAATHSYRLQEASHPVARDLGCRTVGIEQSHNDGRAFVHPKDQPIGANTGTTVAQVLRQFGGVRGHLVDEGNEKVVSESVMFRQMHPTSMYRFAPSPRRESGIGDSMSAVHLPMFDGG